MAVPKTGVFRRKSGNRQTIQEFGKAEFWSFCAFAEKNAVFLTNQGCKGGKSGNRQTVQEFCFAEFFSFCTRLLVKQKLPDAKALVGVRLLRKENAPHYQEKMQNSVSFG